MKKIYFSQHALDKIKLLAERGIKIEREIIMNAIYEPEKIESAQDRKKITQIGLNEKLVLRVVYKEFPAFFNIITIYPGRRSRYE